MALTTGLMFLAASVTCSVAVGALIKAGRTRGLDVRQAIFMNYIVASLLCLGLLRPDLGKLLSPGQPILFFLALGVLLPVPLIITPEYKPGVLADTLDIKLKATWLVCRKECIPQDGEFALKIPLRSSTALNGAAFDAALKSQPADVAGAHQVALKDDGKRLAVRVAGLPADVRGQPLELFPESPGVVVTAATPAKPGEPVGARSWSQHWDGDVWTADVPVSPERADTMVPQPRR